MENLCKHCGACCTVDTYIINPPDIKRWEAEGREDILKHVVHMKFKEDKCPFYHKESEKGCLIEDTKPIDCRNFPLNEKLAMSFTKGKCEIFTKKV